MAGKKRELSVCEIDSEEKDLCVHGVPISLSPKKKSRRNESLSYFDGSLSDGKKSLRMVSFNTNLFPQMKKAEESESVLAVNHADVKRSSRSGELEIFINSKCDVGDSSLEVDIDALKSRPGGCKSSVKIADLLSVSLSQVVNVVAKVVSIKDVEEVTKKDGHALKKQDVIIGDESGSCRLVLWEGDVRSVEEGKTYRFNGLTVKQYDFHKYLSLGANGSKTECEDLGEVNEEDLLAEESDSKMKCITGEVLCVISSSEYPTCKLCNSRVVEDGVTGSCSKCKAVYKMSKCPVSKSAKVVVSDVSTGKEYTLSIFEPLLSRVVEGVSGATLSMKLVLAPCLTYKFNDRNVIFSVSNPSTV